MGRLFSILLMAAMSGVRILAQGAGIEALSIKAASPDEIASHGAGSDLTAGQMRMWNISLADIVMQVNGLKPFQMDIPDWCRQARFDLTAKLTAPAQRPAVMAALLPLVTQRFQIRSHYVEKPMPVYELVPAPGGFHAAVPPPGMPAGAMTSATDTQGNTHLAASAISLSSLADHISRFADRPVVDATGLSGAYAVVIDFNNAPATDGAEPPQPPLVVALRKQAGLQLKPGSQGVRMLVVDAIQHEPQAN